MCLLYNAKLMGSVFQSNLHVRSPLVTATASTFWEASCKRPRTYLRGLIIMYCIFCATHSIRRIFLVISQSLTNRKLEFHAVNSPSKIIRAVTSTRKRPLWFDHSQQPPPVSDH